MAVRLSVIIPTIGRDTLAAALDSCAGADEIIVVADQRGPGNVPPLVLPPNAARLDVYGGDHGYTARAVGMARATGTHLAFLDDDDVYTDGAIDLMRQHASDRPVVFRMDHYNHGILWRNQVLEFGNVSTQMILVPNQPDRLGVWKAHAPGLAEPGGDYTFLTGCVERMGGPVWRPEIIAKLRPHMPTVAIVTPWRNHPELLDGYIAAVACRSHRDELVVVDNGSDPPLGLPGVRLEENAGFCRASNIGANHSRTDAVLYLNNDIEATSRDWLETIRAALEPGVLVGRVRYDGHADVDGHLFPYLDGWCLAGMRDDLLELGGFDEGYAEPAYYSDNDLSLRARLAQMTLRPVEVGLRHLGNRTAGPASDPFVQAVTLANRDRYVTRAREALVTA